MGVIFVDRKEAVGHRNAIINYHKATLQTQVAFYNLDFIVIVEKGCFKELEKYVFPSPINANDSMMHHDELVTLFDQHFSWRDL